MEKNEDLLTFSEFCKYMGICNTLGKEIINHPKCNFVLRVGSINYNIKMHIFSKIKMYSFSNN